jgi:hypothetical protein
MVKIAEICDQNIDPSFGSKVSGGNFKLCTVLAEKFSGELEILELGKDKN